MSGRQVGNYRIIEYSGGGGFGSVFKAEDINTPGRIVAIKELHKKHTRSQVIKQRFFQEAVAMAHLNHPNLPRLYTFGEENGLYYLVMEFLAGRPLTDEIHERGRIAPDRAAAIVSQVLAAISYAHQNGIIHRDLKPDNVMLLADDNALRVKVLDFGIARMIGGDNLTVAGEGLGTPAYMSPERIAGSLNIDQRTDIYSVGIILYEMLSGRVPFESSSTDPAAYWTEMRHLHTSQPLPPLSSFGVARDFEQVVARATAKRPEDRYATADEMLADLKTAMGEEVAEEDLPAHLLITTAPAPAEVYVDDVLRGSSDGDSGRLLIKGLTPELHAVRVLRTGYNEYRINVALEAGRRTDLQVALAARITVAMPPDAATAPADNETQALRSGSEDKTATLVINSLPSGSTVYIGAEAVTADQEGRATFHLNQGVHQIQVATPSGAIAKQEVAVTDKDTGHLKAVNFTVAAPVPVTDPIPEVTRQPSRTGRRIAWAIIILLLLALAAAAYWVARNPGRAAALIGSAEAQQQPNAAAPELPAQPTAAPAPPDKKPETPDLKQAAATEKEPGNKKPEPAEETPATAPVPPEPPVAEETPPADPAGQRACIVVEVKDAGGVPLPGAQVIVGQRPRGGGMFVPGTTNPGGRSRHCDLPVGARVGIRVILNGRVIGTGTTEVIAGGRLVSIQADADAPPGARPFPNRRGRRIPRYDN